MTEIRNERWREQYGITFNDAIERQDEAVRVIRSSGCLVATIARVDRSDFKDLYQTPLTSAGLPIEKGIAEPDYLCFMGYINRLLGFLLANRPEATQVNIHVARKGDVTKRTREFFDCYKKQQRFPEFAAMLGEFKEEDAKSVEALHASDMLLWLFQRHSAGMLKLHDEYRLGLIGDTAGWLYKYDSEDLNAMGSSLAQLALANKAKLDKEKASRKQPASKITLNRG